MSENDCNRNESTPDDAASRRERLERGKKIGDSLRAMYDDVASEPVPDEFLKLLEDADEASEKEGKS